MSSPAAPSPIAPLRRRLGTITALRRLALANVVANVVIVVTGGAVRLTGSGLGCPTWPRCTADSYTTTAAMGVHGAIEFGNRLLTFGLAGVAGLAVLSALLQPRPRRRPVTLLAVAVFAGIPAQAVVGGVTVLTDLNPWVVAMHFMVSMAVIAAAYALWTALRPAPAWWAPRPLRQLALVLTAVSAAVLGVGTIVTGSGPHAGDADARRTGLDPGAVSQLHADVVFLLLGLSVALWFALRAVGAPAPAVRAAAWLVGVELAQGLVGFVQYLTGLPVVAVLLHMAGACAVWIATLAALAAVPGRGRPALPTPTPAPTATADGRPALPEQPRLARSTR